eukprot:TRINITY_DN4406_c1_g1_i1.p1 TRINITY_DN4406_c1_g1~~TRINITY_DN4406_c1_g1_i1.p1  ORF type:complete len:287 (-),score=15.59 TRINITY_DN4406_c1_g1_i1:303-1163(-)
MWILFISGVVLCLLKKSQAECQTPVFSSVSFDRQYPFQPEQPSSGADFYVYFRATVLFSQPTPVPSGDDFQIYPNGSINTIQPPSGCEEAKCAAWLADGYVELNNFWSASSTTVQLKIDSCQASYVVDHPPLCYPYGVYQPHCASIGPVSDKPEANIVVACSESISGFCLPDLLNCLEVSGPENFTLVAAQDIEPSDFAYTQLSISWKDFDPDYNGKVTIGLTCDLKDNVGQSLIRPIAPYTLTKVPKATIMNPSYKVTTSGVHPFELEFGPIMTGVSSAKESSAK